jgi:hypothetical protein
VIHIATEVNRCDCSEMVTGLVRIENEMDISCKFALNVTMVTFP